MLPIPASFLESFCLEAHSHPSFPCLSQSSPTPRVAGAEAARSNTVCGCHSATPHTLRHGLRSIVCSTHGIMTGGRYAREPLSRPQLFDGNDFAYTDSCIIS